MVATDSARKGGCPTTAAWHDRADDLARWAMARLVNRTDRCGGYYAKDGATHQTTRPARGARDGFVSHGLLVGHFTATGTDDVIGVHALAPDSCGKWLGIDIDAHPGTTADPEANRAFALAMYDELTRSGFHCLLYASNGRGGYHLLVLFDAPVPGETLVTFGAWLVRGHREFGFTKPPEVFPKQARLEGTTEWGNWLRIVGHHHTRDYWPEVFDGGVWVSGAAAVEHVLSLDGDDPTLIPAASLEYRPPGDHKVTRKPHAGDKGDGDSVFDAFNRAQTMESVAALLRRHRWTDAGRRGERWDFRRPDKGDGSLSGDLMLVNGTPIFYTFTTSTDLPDRVGLNPAKLRAELEYGGHDTPRMAKLARALCAEGYGPPEPRVTTSTNGQRIGSTGTEPTDAGATSQPAGDPAAPAPKPRPGPPTGCQVILDYFRTRYRPEFRRGSAVYCADGREVYMSEACAVPDSKLIDRLAGTTDAPRYKGGGLNENALPGFFRTWAKVAWGDLLGELPDEDHAELADEGAAPEEFRRLVRAAMLTELVLGERINEGTATVIQRRPLVQWCQLLAEAGPWRDVRGRRCWCKFRRKGESELVLMVAVRVELFAQLKADRRLCEMGMNTFTRRAERYKVGTSTRDERPHGFSAVVLDEAFVADMVADLPDDEDLVGSESTETPRTGDQKTKGADST